MTSNHRRSKTLCDDFMAGCRSGDLAWRKVGHDESLDEVRYECAQIGRYRHTVQFGNNTHNVRLSQLEN